VHRSIHRFFVFEHCMFYFWRLKIRVFYLADSCLIKRVNNPFNAYHGMLTYIWNQHGNLDHVTSQYSRTRSIVSVMQYYITKWFKTQFSRELQIKPHWNMQLSQYSSLLSLNFLAHFRRPTLVMDIGCLSLSILCYFRALKIKERGRSLHGVCLLVFEINKEIWTTWHGSHRSRMTQSPPSHEYANSFITLKIFLVSVWLWGVKYITLRLHKDHLFTSIFWVV